MRFEAFLHLLADDLKFIPNIKSMHGNAWKKNIPFHIYDLIIVTFKLQNFANAKLATYY